MLGTTRLRPIRPGEIQNADDSVLADKSEGGVGALRLRHTGNLMIPGVVCHDPAVIVDDQETLHRKYRVAHIILRSDGRRITKLLGPP